jgi:hypothetical protein
MASNNLSRAFGSGVLWGTPAGGTPQQFGTLQDVTVDFSFTAKKLMGQFQFPVAVGRGAGSVSGKAKFANIDGGVLFNLFFSNVTPTANQKDVAFNEAGSIPTTPFQVTVTNSATFDQDLGVAFTLTGLQLTKVASGPATGQYSVAAGVYTFAAADTGKAVLISYSYIPVVAGTAKAVITNPLMGIAPTFQVDFYQTNPNVAGSQWSLRLYSCLSVKLTLPSKIDDFIIPEFDFEAFANASNNIGEFNTATYTA